MPPLPHITVCICTFRRTALLRSLLAALERQHTGGAFTYSVVVVDNDAARSAEPVVAEWRSRAPVAAEYVCEPARNIARARNAAVTSSRGDYVAFIDDDEEPEPDWLLRLFDAMGGLRADAVLGPVVPRYAETPPRWLVQCGFLDRPRCPTGTVLTWSNTRTGNVLLARRVFEGGRVMFEPQFRHSEDQDFFKRVIARGGRVVWCDEAVVHEVHGNERFALSYFLKRSLLRGNVSLRQQPRKGRTVAKSLLAVCVYAVVSPACGLWGNYRGILYLVKGCDHVGKLLAAIGVDLQPHLASVHGGQ